MQNYNFESSNIKWFKIWENELPYYNLDDQSFKRVINISYDLHNVFMIAVVFTADARDIDYSGINYAAFMRTPGQQVNYTFSFDAGSLGTLSRVMTTSDTGITFNTPNRTGDKANAGWFVPPFQVYGCQICVDEELYLNE